MTIKTLRPHDHCCLSFTKVGDEHGSEVQNSWFLLEVLEVMVQVEAEPAGSTPIPADISMHSLKFLIEPIQPYPMDSSLEYAALSFIYNLVEESEVREFLALLICREMVLGRFWTWLLDQPSRD